MSKTREAEQMFESIYREFHAMVLQICIGYMKGDVDMAKDVAQDVFINTWNALEKFRGESSYKTWIYRITVNTCLMQIRNQKNKISSSLENIPLKAEPVESETENDNTELYRAIGKLAEIDRLIIMLVLEELDYSEIEKIMGINSIHLRVKIHRIRKTLKKLLKPL